MSDEDSHVELAPAETTKAGTTLEMSYVEYFDQVPVWDNLKEEPQFAVVPFEVEGKVPSGRLPVIRLNGWHDLPSALENDFFSNPVNDWVFRGQRRYDWELSPSLGRYDTNGIVKDELANCQLEYFKKAVRGRLLDYTVLEDENEIWSIGQHHGLATPLLDWTKSPYVALFFAFTKEDVSHEDDNLYRVIYALDKKVIGEDGRFPEIKIVEPIKDDHGRLVNQAGLFIKPPYETTIENAIIDYLVKNDDEEIDLDDANALAQYICKIYIPNERTRECVKHLHHMNVHHASLFPDLIGASEFCNSLLSGDALLLKQKDAQAEIEEALATADIEKLGAVNMDFIPAVHDVVIDDEEVGAAPESVDVSVTGVESVTSLGAPGGHVLNGTYSADDDKIIRYATLLGVLETDGYPNDELPLLVKDLDYELRKNMVIDWRNRDSVKAKLRNVIRRMLRKYNYPENERNAVVSVLLGSAGEGES